jgi:MFS family permease
VSGDAPPSASVGEAPGIREQIGRTRGALTRLVKAHRELAQAEIGDILDEVKGVVILAGIAIALLILASLIVPIGLSLFVGEWLFGSIGWGLLHGPLLLIGIAVACVVAALGTSGGAIARDLVVAILVGLVVGVVLGLDLSNQAWTRLGESLAPGVETGVRPLAVGAGVTAIVVGVIGLLLGLRGGGAGSAVGGLIAGAILGAILGAFTAIALGPRVGAAVGVTVALIAWPSLMGATIARAGVDTDQLKRRFWPSATIDTTKETIEWVRARTPLGPRS